MKRFEYGWENNPVSTGERIVSYEYVGGNDGFMIFVCTTVCVSSIIAAGIVGLNFASLGIPLSVTLLALFFKLFRMSLAGLVIFIVAKTRNISTGFEIYSDRICGVGRYYDDDFLKSRKRRFDLSSEDITSVSLNGCYFEVYSEEKKYAVKLNTRDFKKNMKTLLKNNQFS